MPEITHTSAPTYKKIASAPRLAHFDFKAESGDSVCAAILGACASMVLRSKNTTKVNTESTTAISRYTLVTNDKPVSNKSCVTTTSLWNSGPSSKYFAPKNPPT